MKAQDDFGDLLSQFYRTYGRPDESPPDGLKPSEIIPQTDSI
jgi:hypothetical protein